MIRPQLILKDLFSESIPEVKAFHYGNLSELKNWMNAKAKENIYPLAWMEFPLQNDESRLDNSFRTDTLRMFFATSTRKEWLNDKRKIETFDKVLVPVYDNFLKQANLQTKFSFVGRDIEVYEQPNWHTSNFETFEQGHEVNAYWDVISLRFTARFNNNCK